MKRNAVAINTMEIPPANGDLPDWVPLVPAGQVIGRDGRQWRNPHPEQVAESFRQLRRDLPIDIEHSTELKGPKGEPAPAVGWVMELEVRAGEIWGRTEWTGDGKALVANRAYRYLSPVIIYDRASGDIVGITSVGLTNQPNLVLPALNSDNGGDPPPHTEDTMLKALLAALGLPEDADQETALAKIKELKSEMAAAANRAEAPSLEKFVPRADYDAALARATNAEQAMKGIRQEQLEASITMEIEKALQEGKITPATVEYHKAQCRQEGGLERFAEFVKAAPAIGGASGLDGRQPKDQSTALNSEQAAIAAMFGNSAEDLAKYGK
jgi:phage I-like protein